MKSFLILAALAVASPLALSQTTTVESVPVTSVTYVGTYDLASGELLPAPPPTGTIVYDNTTGNGSFFPAGTDQLVMDWGTLSAGGRNAISTVQLGYATTSTAPIDLGFALHAGATGFGDPGAPVTQFDVAGLPGSVTGGAEAFIVDVALPFKVDLPDGPIGYSYTPRDDVTGPLTIGPPNEAGVEDAFDQYSADLSTYVGTFFFGGTPVASFHCALTGETPAECFLVLGDGPGNDDFIAADFQFETAVNDIQASYEVLMNDYPTFVLPAGPSGNATGGIVGSNPDDTVSTNVNLPDYVAADGTFAVQVMMWNPTDVPANPEQYSNGLFVRILPDGSVMARPFGQGEIDIWLETGTNAQGETVFSFPFQIQGL